MMLAGVSHDLKTPLTRMKLLLESIKDNKIKNELNLEINQMNEMLVEYLDFAAVNESKDKSTINPIEAIINIKKDNWVWYNKKNPKRIGLPAPIVQLIDLIQ